MEDSAALESIERVLDERVRPVLREHGGNIRVLSLEGGALKVRMQGNCNNCPSAAVDVEQLAATEIQAAIPDVKSVVLVTGVSDELLETARTLMKNR